MDERQPLLEPRGSVSSGQPSLARVRSPSIAQPILGRVTSLSTDLPAEPIDPAFEVVAFNENDSENPMNWPKTYKRGVISLLAFMAFTVTFTCIGVVPIANEIVLDLEGKPSKSASVLLVTIWELGEAAGPLLIAPLSEVYGRYPVFNCANVLFIVWTVAAASSGTSKLFIFSRFMTGCCVASNVLNPAIIGDILQPDQRGSAMSILMLAPLIGGAVGPAIAGAITETVGWRQVLWIAACIATICEIVFFFMLRETYKISILKRRASAYCKETDDEDLIAAIETENENSAATIWMSIKRPAQVFYGSVVLQIMSLYGALIFTFFYIMSTTLPPILEDIYGWSPAKTGSAFLSFSVGSAFGIVVCNLALDRIYIRLRESNKGTALPEFRMPLVVIGAFLVPTSVVFLGVVAEKHWPVPLLLFAVGLLGCFMLVTVVPLMAYVVDVFGIYSASALTAVLISRCLVSTFLPLAIVPLVAKLGYALGFLVLAAACLVVAPIPWVVMRYGSRWRQYSEYTRDD